jgi:hypothetical protein
MPQEKIFSAVPILLSVAFKQSKHTKATTLVDHLAAVADTANSSPINAATTTVPQEVIIMITVVDTNQEAVDAVVVVAVEAMATVAADTVVAAVTTMVVAAAIMEEVATEAAVMAAAVAAAMEAAECRSNLSSETIRSSCASVSSTPMCDALYLVVVHINCKFCIKESI